MINSKQRAVVLSGIVALVLFVICLPIQSHIEPDGINVFFFKPIWKLFGGYKTFNGQVQYQLIAIEIFVTTLITAGLALILRDDK